MLFTAVCNLPICRELFFLFSDESQLWSLPFSFLSLVLASNKLFFSQRLGIYSDEDPSFKMSLIVAPFNICILMGTLYSLVMMATYAQGYVVVLIGTIVLLNLIFLKLTYLSKDQKDDIIDKFYNQQKESGTKETYAIFLNALFTAWVSPCTVWSSKLKFLMVSSSITLSVHLINLFSLYLIADSDVMNQIENPPILHCFKSYQNFSYASYNFFSQNGIQRMITVCTQNDECYPLIRICSKDEMPNTLMYTYIIPTGILLLFISSSASLCLQILSNYKKMYSLSNTFCLTCQKTYFWFLTDFVFTYNNLDETMTNQVMNDIKKEVAKNVAYQEAFKNLFCLHYEYFESSEETKSLFSKLEEISKDNEHRTKVIAKETPQVVWKLPPMHAAVINNKFGLWCFMYILGGEAGALNGQNKSSINLIIEKFKSDKNLSRTCNSVSRHLIKKAKEIYGEFALHKAIKLGDIRLLKTLIANGYDIDGSDNHNKNPLLLALEIQNVDFLKLLLQHEATVKEEHIEVASALKSYNYLQILLQPTVSNTKLNRTRNTVLLSTAISGKLHLLQVLIENNANVNVKNEQGQSPLHKSAEKGHLECIKYLIENKADVNAIDEKGQNALHIATWEGHLECMKYLIDNKAEINAIDNEGQTSLHITAEKGHLECLKYLIENKADVNVMDLKHNTPLHVVGEDYWSRPYQCAEFLIRAGADLNASNIHGETPMTNAIVKLLKKIKPEIFGQKIEK
jgi:ankyrin repeat protein